MPMSDLRFIVIEPDVFVARDLEEGLRTVCRNCRVERVPSLTEAAETAPDPLHKTVFVTASRLQAIDESGLARRALDQKAQIVVRAGHDSDDAVRARGYELLPTPFTDDLLLTVARRLQSAV